MSPVPALERALAALRSRPDAVVLVDGRSGSGKTTFAAALAEAGRSALLRLDDVYPGWDGLDAASRALAAALGVRCGSGAALRGWDWAADAPAGLRHLRPSGALVVEGCGALSQASSPRAALRIWVDLPEGERRARALERDGDAYAPHWDRWARQERAFLAREHPRALADVIVDGARFPQRAFSARSADPHYSRRP